MKLDNKGFAFSTILYGALALIVVVLMLLFNVLKNTKDETYYYSSVLEETLNKCVTEEVALENCYTSKNPNCDPTTYYACLGIVGTSEGEGLVIAEHLKRQLVSSGDGLYQDSVNPKRYVYRGSVVNNYLSYSGVTWRIVGIEPDGSIKIISLSPSTTVQWDANNHEEWGASTLNNYLNQTFYATLSDTSHLQRKTWYIGRIYNTISTLQELVVQENKAEYSGKTGNEGYIGILNTSDYIAASLNIDCTSHVLSSSNCESWLSSYKSWLLNTSGDVTEIEADQLAYYFDNNHKLSTRAVTTTFQVLPVAYLNRGSVIIKGDGTVGNPYVLK